jgi:hypothetical protein
MNGKDEDPFYISISANTEQRPITVKVNCTEDISQQVVDKSDTGLDVGNFIIRTDFEGRWIIKTKQFEVFPSYVVVQPWVVSGNVYLSVFIVQPISGESSLGGICSISSDTFGIDFVKNTEIDRWAERPERDCLQRRNTQGLGYVMPTTTTYGPFSNPNQANSFILSLLELETRTFRDSVQSKKGSQSTRSLVPESAHGLLQGSSFATLACKSDTDLTVAMGVCESALNTVSFKPCLEDACTFPSLSQQFAVAHTRVSVTLAAILHHMDTIQESVGQRGSEFVSQSGSISVCPR